MEMNQQVAQRRRQAKPVAVDQTERYYRAQLQSLVRAMAKAVAAEILPILKEEKSNFIADHDFMDRWLDRLVAALQSLSAQWVGQRFERQVRRLAASTVSMAEAESTAAFLQSVNRAVGVDLSNVISREGLADYLDMAVEDNVSLIKSISSRYFERVESIVLSGVRDGDAPTTIAKRLSEQTGATYKRARLIARDQVAKLNSDITAKRQTEAGITHFRWITSNDERVTGRPGGKYSSAKIKCWEIAKKDIGFGPGVYRWKEGASYGGESGLKPGKAHINCRCTASPVFEWELPEK